jgi:hypothetical protein
MFRFPLALKILFAAATIAFPALTATAVELTVPVLGPAAYTADNVHVATNGRAFLRLFRMNGLIYASPTDSDGLSSATPRAVTDRFVTQLVSTGDGYVALAATAYGSELRLLRLAEDGALIAEQAIPVVVNYPRLTWNGRNLLLTGINGNARLEARLLSADGRIDADLGVIGPEHVGTHAVATSDGDFLIAAGAGGSLEVTRISGTTVTSIYADTIASGALVLDLAARRESIVIKLYFDLLVVANNAVTHRETVSAETRVVATANGYALVQPVPGTSSGRIIRLDATGQRLDASALLTTPGYPTNVAAAGNLVQVVGFQAGLVAPKVIASSARVDVFSSSGALTEVLSILPRRQLRPAAASDGVHFLGAVNELTADSSTIAAAPVLPVAAPAANAGTVLGTAALPAAPALAGFPHGYLAVWSGPDALLGAFLTFDGFTDPPFTIAATTVARDPAVAWNGTTFLVIWSNGSRIFGAPVSATGSAGEVQQISPEPGTPINRADSYDGPDVAWDGARFVVDWLVHPPVLACVSPCYPNPANGILVERVDADGRPLDAKPLTAIVDSPRMIDRAHMASSGDGTALMAIEHDGRLEIARIHDSVVDAPQLLFEWANWLNVPRLAADVTFSAGAYELGWRVADPNRSFITTAMLPASGSGMPFNSRSTVVQSGESGSQFYGGQFYGPLLDLAVAANSSGDIAVVASEVSTPGDSARAHAHFAADMAPTPPPPQTPDRVSADYLDGVLTVTWSAVDDGQAFVVVNSGGAPLAFAPAGATRATISTSYRGLVQVRAYNAGGISAATAPVPVVVLARHRATGRR